MPSERSDPPDVHLVPDGTRSRAYLLQIGNTDQSYVDLDDPTRLDFDYMQRIAEAIDAIAPAGRRIRVLHIGGAGLSLARYVAETRPGSPQLVLEPDEQLTAFVREHLPLGRHRGIKVRPVDGRRGVTELGPDFADLVVLDAFVGSRVPAELTTVEFFTDVRRVLIPGGTLMINITDQRPLDYSRRVVAGVRAVFEHTMLSAEPATLKGRRFGNVVMLASAAPLPIDELEVGAARTAFPYRVLHGRRLTQWLAGARPFSGTDSAMSPPAPGGLLSYH